jgi:hypothetical protein
MLFRVLDIETVPDTSAYTPGEPRWSLIPSTTSATGMGLRQDESWPPPQANRVVAVSSLTMEATLATKQEGRRYIFKDMQSSALWGGPDDERRLISEFGELQTQVDATIISWAGRSFDLPVLAMRALKYGLNWSWYYDTKSVRYRYSDEGHCDLMDALADYGASRPLKLGDAAKLVGLPGKTDMDGSKVSDLVALGPDPQHQARIRRYCGHDVLQTALVFLRTRVLFGRLQLDEFRASAESFKAIANEFELKVDWPTYLMLDKEPNTP